MANKLLLEVVTPSRQVVNEEVDLATAPGADGVFGVMANHAPLLATMAIGEMHYEKDGTVVRLALSGGFCEVSNNRMTILAESAEPIEEIDVERALKAKERAEKRLQAAAQAREDIDMARAQAALARAMNRLKLAGRE